ncbi:CU044_5270 family protein [Streptomyces sp. MAR25Y5]|uniref:CU044_5270 family protein n=1 Tax=Streptomyces sp. MAR25Y5 TaxID=2962028 RepID=UPI0020B75545|nr:CU044_5270 family protein [Streptomyces sp. MAR25Y5]MCP3770861.1 CU044_5270 family protein [Streptomyces sp. MAR25Y5]
MNADRPPRTGSAAGSARSAAEDLLASAEWDLPPSRHLRHKEVLMQQIDRTPASPAPAPSPRTPPAPHRRRLPRPALAVPAVSMALAGALFLTFSGDGHGSAPAVGAGSAPAEVNSASVTLDRIAAAAMKTDATPVKDGQFVYIERLTRGNTGSFNGPVRLGALHRQEVWTAQDPGPVTRTGWMRETGEDAVMPGQMVPVESAEPVRAGIDHPTYEWLASLPTDPDALLELLHSRTGAEGGDSKDQAVFGRIGDLLSSTIMPPATASGLYKAVERIPGVTQVPDAVDAAGRHGIGITREDAGSATRDVWIFDKDTLAYLGSRSYITGDEARGITTDTLYGIDAVMARAVVDRHGEEPAGTGN